MAPHSGSGFSTFDVHNDRRLNPELPCDVGSAGAWWFAACEESHLNGDYYTTGPGRGISCDSFGGTHYSHKRSEMKY